jgi:hypothetical protein
VLNQIDEWFSIREVRAEEAHLASIASGFIDGAIAVKASWVERRLEAYTTK